MAKKVFVSIGEILKKHETYWVDHKVELTTKNGKSYFDFMKFPLFGKIPFWRPKTAGIYFLVNSSNSNFYVGSTVNIYQRMHDHRFNLDNKVPKNDRLQESYDNSRREDFYVIAIPFRGDQGILKLEQEMIDFFWGDMRLLNRSPTSESSKGLIKTIVARRKLSTRTSRNFENAEYRKKHSDGLKRYNSIQENRQKLIDRGRLLAEDTKWLENQKLAATEQWSNPEKKARLLKAIEDNAVKNGRRVSVNGIVYRYPREAMNRLGIPPTTLIKRLKSKEPRWSEYFYLDEREDHG